ANDDSLHQYSSESHSQTPPRYHPSVNEEIDSGDTSRLPARREGGDCRDLLGLSEPAERGIVQEPVRSGGDFQSAHLGVEGAWGDGDYPRSLRSDIRRHLHGVPDDEGFARAVCRTGALIARPRV